MVLAGIQRPEHLVHLVGSLGSSDSQQLSSFPKLSLISGISATKTPPVLRTKPLEITELTFLCNCISWCLHVVDEVLEIIHCV